MKKYENFCRCLAVLKGYDEPLIRTDEIYRMGVIGQFNLSFELAWKVLQAVLIQHSVEQASTGSPREIVKLGFKYGFLSDETVWLDMLNKRNTMTHIYSKENAEEIIEPLISSFIPALEHFRDSIAGKIENGEERKEN